MTDTKTLAGRLREAVEKHSSPTIGRGDIHGGQKGWIIYEGDGWPFILERWREILSADALDRITPPDAGVGLETTAEERQNARFNLKAHLEGGIIISVPEGLDNLASGVLRFLNDIDTLTAALAAEKARADAQAIGRSPAWALIDDDAKDGTKVELIIGDIYDRARATITIGYWQDGRWWGSGISSHWAPVMYRRITEDEIAAALAAHRPEVKAALQAACDHHGDWEIEGDGRGEFFCSRCGADMGPRDLTPATDKEA